MRRTNKQSPQAKQSTGLQTKAWKGCIKFSSEI